MLSRILSRYLRVWDDDVLYLVDQNPSWDIRQEAEENTDSIISREPVFSLSRNECIKELIRRGILADNYKQVLTRYENTLKNQQKQLYRADGNPPKENEVRQAIKKIRSSISTIKDNESTLEYICRENYKQFVLDLELIKLSTFNHRRKPVKDPPVWVIYLYKLEHCMDNKELRKMARSESFRFHWSMNKIKVFKYSPLTDMQIVLAGYSRMYDSVYKSMDVPSESVINDDDKLDGWWEIQIDDRSSRKKGPASKVGQHGEVFQVVQNQEEAQQVYDSNSGEARSIQRSRLSQLKQRGSMNISDFNDIKQKRAMQNAAAQTR